MIDVNKVLTPERTAQIKDLVFIGDGPNDIHDLLAERETLLAALAEFEVQWGDYGNIQYCQACCNIGDARGFAWEHPNLEAVTSMPHKDYCAHTLAEAILKRARGE